MDRKAEVARDMRRQVLGGFCLGGLLAPPVAALIPILPKFENPGPVTIVFLVLGLSAIYILGEAIAERASMFLLGFPPLVRLANWAKTAPAGTSGRRRRYLYVAGALAFYWSIGIGAAIAIYMSGLVHPPWVRR